MGYEKENINTMYSTQNNCKCTLTSELRVLCSQLHILRSQLHVLRSLLVTVH